MMQRIRNIAVVVALLTTQPAASCNPTELLAAIPELVKLGGAIVEAVQLLRQLDTEASRLYPQGAPGDYIAALQICQATLTEVQRAQVDAKDRNDQTLAQKISAFRVAFVELRMAASRNGIITPEGTLAGVGHVGDSFGGPSPYRFPDPVLLDYNK